MHGIIMGGMIDFSYPSQSDLSRHAGSHRVASYLRSKGYDVEVLDFVISWHLDELKEFIRTRVDTETKFIGVGAIFELNTKTIIELFEWVKEKYPNIKLVAGAQAFHSIHRIPADYHIIGYGEKALEQLLIDGEINYIEEPYEPSGKLKRKTVYALHQYKAFPLKDLSINYEDRDYIESNEILNLECARGCIFSCKFCTYPILGVRDDHTRSAENFRDNLIENYEKWGVKTYNIVDETFNDYTDKIRKYADVVESLYFKPSFHGFLRADLLSKRPEDKEHLARMNFNSHYYGIETFNRESGKAVGKGGDPEKIKDSLLDIKEYFKKHTGSYHGTLSMIVGLPHETFDTLNKSRDWIETYWSGQYVHWNNLIIPKKASNIKASTFTENYLKYGYVETDEQFDKEYREDLVNSDIPTELKWYLIGSIDQFNQTWMLMPWKNTLTGMSWISASKWIVENFYKREFFYDMTPAGWDRYQWSSTGYDKDTNSKSFRKLGKFFPTSEEKMQVIENYKKKKLNSA